MVVILDVSSQLEIFLKSSCLLQQLLMLSVKLTCFSMHIYIVIIKVALNRLMILIGQHV